MKIVVAGGTGFLGRHITRRLIDRGHEVSVLGRSPSKASAIPALAGAGAVQADITDPSSLPAALRGHDAVVDCVQFPNHPIEVPRKGLTYDRFDRQGVENLIAAAGEAGVARFVYISGVGADPASERSWYRAKGFAEQALWDSALDHVILRPSWAYGPEDKALNKIAMIARWSPVVPRLGVSPQLINPVHVDDIAEAVARVFEVDDSWGRTFEIGGPQVMTMDEVTRTLIDALGKRRTVLPIPASLARLGTAALVLLPKPPMTPQGINFATQDGVADNSETEEVLGVEPVALREGLARYIR